MAKLTSRSQLTLGTNLVLHVVDKGGTDISFSGGNTISSSTTDFTASSTTGGITNRAIVVGDILKIAHTDDNDNEGVEVAVTAVTANSITYSTITTALDDEIAGADINITARLKTYQFLEASGLSFIDGVEGIALNSKITDLFHDGTINQYPEVFTSIEPRAKSMASINGWEPHDASTLNAIRDMALEVRPSRTAAATKIYACFRSNGNLDEVTDQMTVWFSGDAALDPPLNAVMTGYINQLFLVFDSTNSIDKRGTWFYRCAEPGKTILYDSVTAQFAEILPTGSDNPTDPKLTNAATGQLFVEDATIASGGIYANVEYFLDADSIFSGNVDGTNYDFTGYVEDANQTYETVHRKINYLWRQPTDINADGTGPTLRGDKQPPLTSFSGDVFTVQAYLDDNANSNGQRNNLRVIDVNDVERSWEAVNTITILPSNEVAEGGLFTVFHNNTIGTAASVALQDASSIAQEDITIAASNTISFGYGGYNVDGHTPGTPLDIVVAFSRPGFIEADFSAVTTLSGADVTISLPVTVDPSYRA